MVKPRFSLLSDYPQYPQELMKQRSYEFYKAMEKRRSVRNFSDRPVDRTIIENCLRAAATAPSGANMQPWYFVIVSDPAVKRKIREASEKVEQAFYSQNGTRKWVKELKPLGTGPEKPFLETAPYLIVVFSRYYSLLPDGGKRKHYYVIESVGIATGILITAIHHSGLACLTYTPARMGFLNRILSRPKNERPFLILVVGYPSADAVVPDITKKPFNEVAVFI
ncbi:MAG: nitroreductase family protein [Deltaproteobacteria bacterium]|nr:nitroreductase family protein [Deltaproteobacteria bacterium]MBW2150427.1 nitroreductase family protein [Deltaproteobacteria bacterium]